MRYFLGKHVKHAANFDSMYITKKLTNTNGHTDKLFMFVSCGEFSQLNMSL
jgi:hypothetical protein